MLFAWSWGPAISSDEAATVVVVRRSWGQIWRVWSHDAALVPYYLVEKAWSELASTSPVILRLPSVAAMAAAVAVVVVLTRDVADLRTAAWTGVAMTALPAVSRFGADARPYAFAMFFCALTVLTWWRHVNTGQARYGVASCVTAILAALMHAYALTVLVALLVTAAVMPAPSRRTTVVRTAVPAVAAAAALIPYLVFVARHAKGQPGVPGISALSVARVAAYFPVSALHAALAPAFAAISLAAAGLGLIRGLRVTSTQTRTLTLLGAIWLVVPPLLLITLQAVTGRPGLVARYWGIATPGLAILVGVLLRTVHGRAQLLLATAVATAAVGTAMPAQVSIRGIDGHLGQRWQLLPSVLRQPALRAFPVLISPSVLRALDAAAPRLTQQRVPTRQDDVQEGLLSSTPYDARSPQFHTYVARAAGFIAYRAVFTGPGGVPGRAAFASLVPRSSSDARLVVRCEYFGDALGVFAVGPDLGSVWAQQIADQIETAAKRHAVCRVAG